MRKILFECYEMKNEYFEEMEFSDDATDEEIEADMKYIVKEVKLMDCLTCGTKMKCVDDINDIGTRIDWVVCPKCGSKNKVSHNSRKKYNIIKI